MAREGCDQNFVAAEVTRLKLREIWSLLTSAATVLNQAVTAVQTGFDGGGLATCHTTGRNHSVRNNYFMSSIGKLMKQAAKMQQQMEAVQAQLAARTVEATSGGGAVKIVAKCDGSLASIKIDPQALNPSDAQIVEDMILTAVNQALAQAKAINDAEMGKATAGFSLPGIM